MQDSEIARREKLGVPADARQVLIFGESSHWDTNWIKTSEEYFEQRIELIFDAVFAALAHDPRRIYSVESVFFLKLYWERRPQQRHRLRELLLSGRLRLLSASLTTPDTLLPGAETIFRDYLLGQEWLRSQELPIFPRTSYFPDNFGHSPSLPSLMRALGITGVGVTRVDGMYFVGSDYRRRSAFPLTGSTAELLQREHKTLDFVWRAADGAEILCHWNAFTYFQGDMLAHTGIIRWAGQTYALPWRSSRHIARRLARYAKELGALSKTPYLFCPIGCDFNAPIFDLGGLLDRYNRDIYPNTGVYALTAGLDDYLDLVSHHRHKLPVLACDPNPYWMGFYATRPEVKQRPVRIARTLLLTEKLSASAPKNAVLSEYLNRAWQLLTLSNHHDYITGTSSDRVWRDEQEVWLSAAEASAAQAWRCVAPPISPAKTIASGKLHWQWHGDELRVQTDHYQFSLSRKRGGCLTSYTDKTTSSVLRDVGNDLIVYHDSGGLWRLGHEYWGGSFKPLLRASDAPAKISLEELSGELRIDIRCLLDGQPYHRRISCHADLPFVRFAVAGRAKRRWTVTCSFATRLAVTRLWMDTPGGHVDRPIEKFHDPTFWPVQSHCALGAAGERLHVVFDTPGALAFRRDQSVEWIIARNAPKEIAFGFLPVLAHPIGGTAPEAQAFDFALGLQTAAWDAAYLATQRRALHALWLPAEERDAWAKAQALVVCSDARVVVTAVKHAEDGRGLIVRLRADDRSIEHATLSLADRRINDAVLCDARETTLAPLPVQDGACDVPLADGIVTVRLL